VPEPLRPMLPCMWPSPYAAAARHTDQVLTHLELASGRSVAALVAVWRSGPWNIDEFAGMVLAGWWPRDAAGGAAQP
jgi:hypothetical protein